MEARPSIAVLGYFCGMIANDLAQCYHTSGITNIIKVIYESPFCALHSLCVQFPLEVFQNSLSIAGVSIVCVAFLRVQNPSTRVERTPQAVTKTPQICGVSTVPDACVLSI